MTTSSQDGYEALEKALSPRQIRNGWSQEVKESGCAAAAAAASPPA